MAEDGFAAAERIERVTRERAEQGLPTPATDGAALALTASILRAVLAKDAA